MKLFEEIKSNWELDIYNNWQIVKSLQYSYPAWTIKTMEGYGVAILYDGEDVREDFSNATIHCENIVLNGENHKVLVLFSKSATMDAAFANLCLDFVNPGEDGEYRKELLQSPVQWWASWKELLGNVSIDERVYDVIGELAVLKYYAEQGVEPIWGGSSRATYDIETSDYYVEVKSSINRSKKEVTISSLYQLSNLNKTLFLVFCTFELAASHGMSINSIVDDLKDLGYNVSVINIELEKLGFGIGKSVRKKQFIMHSMYRYEVDDAFPKLTEASFVGGVLPQGITDASYTVNLSGLRAENLLEESYE